MVVGGWWSRAIIGSNPTVSHQLELVGVVSWTWVGLGFDNYSHPRAKRGGVILNLMGVK